MQEKHSNEILADKDLKDWYEKNWFPSAKEKARRRISRTIHFLAQTAFNITGLAKRGYRNALELEIEYEDLALEGLPKNFDGIRILFLSDFHLGGINELPEIVSSKIDHMSFDICFFGGDYRHCYACSLTFPFLRDLNKIYSSIQSRFGIWGVIGNHDGLELVPALEKIGIKMLINKSKKISIGNQHINIIGIDDFFQGRHNVEMAFSQVSAREFNLILAHSPDLYRQAQEKGGNLFLCGHTHHGQIQLPGIGPIFSFTTAPREFIQGAWRFKNMWGYTGAGLGTVAANVRFRCPPKIVVLTLRTC